GRLQESWSVNASAAALVDLWQGGTIPYSPCYPLLLSSPPLVILSEAKDLTRWAEMLRPAQHDSILPGCRAQVDVYWVGACVARCGVLSSSLRSANCIISFARMCKASWSSAGSRTIRGQRRLTRKCAIQLRSCVKQLITTPS